MAKNHGYYCDHCRYEGVEPDCYPCSDCVYSEFQTKPPSEWVQEDIKPLPVINDSGERTQFASGAVRDMHEGKGDMASIPWESILRLARHYENGAKKYNRVLEGFYYTAAVSVIILSILSLQLLLFRFSLIP